VDPSADDKLEIGLLRQQNPDAFTRFVKRHQRIVLGLCQTLGFSDADGADAAAEVFAAAYFALPGFRGESELSTWLYRIACRTIRKIRRRYPPRPALPDAVVDPAALPPDSAAETRELHERLWAAVARLDPDQAAAVELFYRRGLLVAEVATVLEKPVGTIKTLLFRAREQLRQGLHIPEYVK
jgi:RNA polymerase sigma-70 factor (ECF subfamily)